MDDLIWEQNWHCHKRHEDLEILVVDFERIDIRQRARYGESGLPVCARARRIARWVGQTDL